jgi:hypothetical protein
MRAPAIISRDTDDMNNRIHIQYSAPGRGRRAGWLRSRAAGPIGRALALITGAFVLVAALFVSAIVFSVLLVVGVVAGGWFWWKTRALRKDLGERLAQMQRMTAGPSPDLRARDPAAEVIDGDFIHEAEPRRR